MRRRYDMNGNTEKKEKANGAESAIREGLLLGMHVSHLIFGPPVVKNFQ